MNHKSIDFSVQSYANRIEATKPALATYLRARNVALSTGRQEDWEAAWRAQIKAEHEEQLLIKKVEDSYLDYCIKWNCIKGLNAKLFIIINSVDVIILKGRDSLKFASINNIESTISDLQDLINDSNIDNVSDKITDKFASSKFWEVSDFHHEIRRLYKGAPDEQGSTV